MSYILTSSGKYFDPINPDTSLIDISDIAHALSFMCRANGYTKIFYSVAQHSISCALEAITRHYSTNIALACLLHDAAEAYLSDVTRPIKKDLPYYIEVENKLQNLIWNKFLSMPLNSDEMEMIFHIDDCILSEEFRQLMPYELSDLYKNLHRSLHLVYEDPQLVRKKFINLFNELSEKADP